MVEEGLFVHCAILDFFALDGMLFSNSLVLRVHSRLETKLSVLLVQLVISVPLFLDSRRKFVPMERTV